jgi:phage-related minor tail protein
MASLPDLVGRLRLDMSDLTRAQSEATERGARIGSALGSAVGSLAGGALAAAGAKVTEFVSGSVDAFARLQDSTQAASVVFGSSFGTVERAASTAASSIGVSKSAALDASITFGTFGKAAGLAGEPLAQFSNGMVQLSGDMASFRGTSPEEAITAIGAAFRGEFDPIEKYGVLINAAKVEQEAERLGLVKHGETMSDHARIMATQSLIYKQTADAQGDFARSGDSVANTQKRIAAETENAQAALGERLAPAYLALLNVLNQVIGGITKFLDVVVPVVQKIWEWKDAIAAVLIVLGIMNAQTIAFNVAAAAYLATQAAIRVATTAWTAVQWLLNAALTANPIGIVITVLAALVAGIIVAYNHSETFRNFVNQLWAALQQLFGWLTANIPGFVSGFVDGFTKANDATDRFWASVRDGATQVGGWLTQANTATDSFWHGVANAFTQANASTDSFWQRVGQLPGQISGALAPLPGQIEGIVSRIPAILKQFILDAWNALPAPVQAAITNIINVVKNLPAQIQAAVSNLAGNLKTWVIDAFNSLPAPVQAAITNVVNFVKGMATNIMGALQALPGQMVTMGHDIINGLLQGLQQLGPQIVSYLTNLIPEPVRKALNIASPSGVFRDIGRNIMQGLQAGLDDLLPQLQSKVQQVIDLVKKGGEAAGSVSVGGQSLDYKVKASAQGVQASGTFAGQSVSGSYDAASGKASVSGLGHTYSIDARSFGTQLKPQDVADAIKWASKIGGLVSA